MVEWFRKSVEAVRVRAERGALMGEIEDVEKMAAVGFPIVDGLFPLLSGSRRYGKWYDQAKVRSERVWMERTSQPVPDAVEEARQRVIDWSRRAGDDQDILDMLSKMLEKWGEEANRGKGGKAAFRVDGGAVEAAELRRFAGEMVIHDVERVAAALVGLEAELMRKKGEV